MINRDRSPTNWDPHCDAFDSRCLIRGLPAEIKAASKGASGGLSPTILLCGGKALRTSQRLCMFNLASGG